MDTKQIVARFEAERQALAMMNHPNVAGVYDAGETESGRPYFVMEYVPGVPITEHCDRQRLTTSERLQLFLQVCQGVQHAHQKAIIHRDLKPSNILVTVQDEHALSKIIDFGVAKATAQPLTERTQFTEMGRLIGTPEYMSPEQAEMTAQNIDTRADVYSLGAVLYELLVGEKAFDSRELRRADFAELRRTIREVDPPRPSARASSMGDASTASAKSRRTTPRALVGQLRGDLDWITMKALEKDRTRRYGSPSELAADIERHLRHEPIRARPPSTGYRIGKFVKRHRIGVGFAATLFVLLVGFAILMAFQAHEIARERDRVKLAQRFGQKVQRIESIARFAAMAPQHDMRPAREMIRMHMAEIESSMRDLGRIARGPGRYALGRGHLAMKSWDEAREHFEAAWEEGFREPEVSYALGLVLGQLYQRKLDEAAQIRSKSQRERARSRAQQTYRDPALGHLRAAAVEAESPDYLAGLLAFYEGLHEKALAHAKAAFESRAWLYEAKRLEGEIYKSMADEEAARGEYDAAIDLFGTAEDALKSAATVAPSDADVYKRLALVARARMSLEINHRGLELDSHFEQGLEALDQALLVDRGDPEAHFIRATLYRRMAEYRISQSVDAGEYLQAAVRAAEHARDLDRDYAKAHSELAEIRRQIGKDLHRRGEDPRPAYEKAIDAYGVARSLDPTQVSHSNRGLLFKDIARYQMSVGEDPRESLQAAIQAYEDEIAINPQGVGAHHNLGVAYSSLAEYEQDRGADPRDNLSRSVQAFQAALEVSPENAIVILSLANAHNNSALYELEGGLDPTENLDRALVAFTRAIDANPEFAYIAYLYSGRGISWMTQARYERSRGLDCQESVLSAMGEFEMAIEASPNYVFAHENLSDLYAFQADHELELGKDPGESVSRAVQHGRDAVAINPGHSLPHVRMADAVRVRAAHRLEAGRNPTEDVAEARSSLGKSRAINPNYPPTFGSLARLVTIEARWLAQSGADPDPRFVEAAEAIAEAIRLTPARSDFHLGQAEVFRRWAEWKRQSGESAEAEIETGLAAVSRALRHNAHAAEAWALRAALLATRAAGPGANLGSTMQEARESLRRALSENPHLTRMYAPVAERIEDLGGGAGRSR
jgi:tetratricopeptide (TPR) repeat protein